MLVPRGTEEEAIENIREAVKEYLAVVEEELQDKRVKEIEVV